MGILLDLMIVCILIISTIIGYKRGLINVVFNLCAFLVALILTFILYKPVTNFLVENTEIDDKIESVIIENGIISVEDNSDNVATNYINQYLPDGVTDITDDIIEETATVVAQKIVGIIAFLILLIVIRLLLIFVRGLVNGIASLPIIKQFNELGGLIYGIFIGFVWIFIILAVLFFVVSINNNGIIQDAVNSSFIAKFLYENNIILNFIF